MKTIKEVYKINIIFVLMITLNFILTSTFSVKFSLIGILGWAAALINCTIYGGKFNESIESI